MSISEVIIKCDGTTRVYDLPIKIRRAQDVVVTAFDITIPESPVEIAAPLFNTDYKIRINADNVSQIVFMSTPLVTRAFIVSRNSQGELTPLSQTKYQPDRITDMIKRLLYRVEELEGKGLLSIPSVLKVGAVEVTNSSLMESLLSSAASYTHDQLVASSSWNVNHNLGFKPTISLFSNGGLVFDAEIVHNSINQSIVYLSAATSGYARCN